MTALRWEEWDGNGFDEAHAWTPGTRWVERDALLALRVIGADPPPGKRVELVRGYVGKFHGEDELEACNAVGCTWADDESWVVPETIQEVTFAVFVERD